jgi:hypothetical protein
MIDKRQLVAEHHRDDFTAFVWANAATELGHRVVFVGINDARSWMVWIEVPGDVEPEAIRKTITDRINAHD